MRSMGSDLRIWRAAAPPSAVRTLMSLRETSKSCLRDSRMSTSSSTTRIACGRGPAGAGRVLVETCAILPPEGTWAVGHNDFVPAGGVLGNGIGRETSASDDPGAACTDFGFGRQLVLRVAEKFHKATLKGAKGPA